MTATINNIKDRFNELVGEDIVVTVEMGRSKTVTHEGVLTETYPAVFVVELDEVNQESYERVSYNYTDVLTDTIQIDFPNVENVDEDETELLQEVE